MRYSVQFQSTTCEWVLFDTVALYMLPGRFKSEEDAYVEAAKLTEADRLRVLGSKPVNYACDRGLSSEYPESSRVLLC